MKITPLLKRQWLLVVFFLLPTFCVAQVTQVWVARYNGPGNSVDEARSLAADDDGNVYVTGNISNSPPGLEDPDSDFATIKYTSAGVQLWVAKYGPTPDQTSAQAHAIDQFGNVYVTGQGADNNYATVKFNTNGQQEWAIIYNNDQGLSNEAALAVAVDEQGNVYVTGHSDGDGTGFDYATIKYSQTLIACGEKGNKVLICHKGKKTLCISNSTIAEHIAHGDQMGECSEAGTASAGRESTEPSGLTRELPAHFRIFNAPNPASGISKIYYELPYDGHVSIQVYDITGRQIATLVNGSRKAGYHNIDLDVSALQKGVYNYRITVKTTTKVWFQTKKIIVIN